MNRYNKTTFDFNQQFFKPENINTNIDLNDYLYECNINKIYTSYFSNISSIVFDNFIKQIYYNYDFHNMINKNFKIENIFNIVILDSRKLYIDKKIKIKILEYIHTYEYNYLIKNLKDLIMIREMKFLFNNNHIYEKIFNRLNNLISKNKYNIEKISIKFNVLNSFNQESQYMINLYQITNLLRINSEQILEINKFFFDPNIYINNQKQIFKNKRHFFIRYANLDYLFNKC